MANPIIFRGLTEEQANATAEVQRSTGAKAEVIPDGTGTFSVRVTLADGRTPAPSPGPPPGPPPTPPGGPTQTLSGRMSTFGGPDDPGVRPSEGLAIMTPADIASFPDLFLPAQPPGTTGLAKRLNPNADYIACRWVYKTTPKAYLRKTRVTVTNPATGASSTAQPVDWGPNDDTSRVADLSPGLAHKLGLQTDDTCVVVVPLPP